MPRRKTYDPYFLIQAKRIAQCVPYSIDAVYDMVLMGLTEDEIVAISRVGISIELPERVSFRGYSIFPQDIIEMAQNFSGIKSESILKNLESVVKKLQKGGNK